MQGNKNTLEPAIFKVSDLQGCQKMLEVFMWSDPVDIRRRFNVYKTSRHLDVETTYCLYWGTFLHSFSKATKSK